MDVIHKIYWEGLADLVKRPIVNRILRKVELGKFQDGWSTHGARVVPGGPAQIDLTSTQKSEMILGGETCYQGNLLDQIFLCISYVLLRPYRRLYIPL